MRVPPLVSFEPIRLDVANDRLIEWSHKMGPLHRGNQDATCHGLYVGKELIGVTCVSALIAPNVGGGMRQLTRDNCCELSRLCAARSGLCRVILRLWREFVFPDLGYEFAISYQDADLHSGNTYRFDGWKRVAYARSGKDTRSGRPGRNKWVWMWPACKLSEPCEECGHEPCECLEKFAMSINWSAIDLPVTERMEK